MCHETGSHNDTGTGDCLSYHVGEWRGCRQSLLFNDVCVVDVVIVYSFLKITNLIPKWIASNVHLEKLTYCT